MLKTILIILGWLVLAFILFTLAMHVVSMLMTLAVVVGIAVLVCAPIYFFLKSRRNKSTQTEKTKRSDARLFEVAGTSKVFLKEPTTAQMLAITDQFVSSNFMELPNDTRIKIVQDDDKAAVKVKITSGASKGKTGWVSRSSIINAQP